MAVGLRTTAAQFGEMPAIFPIQPRTSAAVKNAIAVRGSMIHFPMEAIVSSQLSRAVRGVFAMIRIGSHAGASCTGKVFPHASTSDMPASSSLQAEQAWRCETTALRSAALSVLSR
jgi:hypothetical protein